MRARARLFVPSLRGMVVCVWLLGATGCGSVLYVNQVTRKASTSVAAAKAAEADVYAPYHYTLAVRYLHKAREEAAAADFQAANRFGRLSYEAGEQARELAVQRAADPADTSWKPPPGAPDHDGVTPADAPAAEQADAPAAEQADAPAAEQADAGDDEAAGPGDDEADAPAAGEPATSPDAASSTEGGQ